MAYNAPNGYRATGGTANNPNKGLHSTTIRNGSNASLHEASQTPLPPSSPIIRSPRPDYQRPSSTQRQTPNPTLRRASSSLSIGTERRSSTPTMLRKTSTSSLRDMPPTPTRGLANRRSSSQLNPNSPLAPAVEEPAITENTVAEEFFRQELETHEVGDADVNTVVIVHEACYGHRFARPKTTKATLGLIVERPERIEASVMGISAAYVRLGERHNEGRFGPDPRKMPPHLPFKIRRTKRELPITSPAVTQVHGTKWMEELRIMCHAASVKLASTGRETERPPDPTQKDKPAFHSGDLYLCPDSLAAFEGALGGVCDGVDAVFNGSATGTGPSQAFVCIRPPGHHCSADFPSGFCWINNVHVGIQHAVREHQLTHAAIIDFDLHHGDGSQSITWDLNSKIASMPKNTPAIKKTAIGYYSIHDINSYPCENGDTEKIQNASICVENAHNQSIWNVHLQPWRTETEFWELYETRYMQVLEKARVFLKHHTARLRGNPNLPKPCGAIFISAGFDASEHEGAGMQRHSVNVPTEFYARFTRDIVALAQEEGTGVNGRVISVLEGGYSDKALISGVLSHVSGLCHGQHVKATKKVQDTGDSLAAEMSRLNVGGLSGLPEAGQLAGIDDIAHQLRYNSEWWTSEHLDALVEILNPAAKLHSLEAAKQTARSGAFASPTQASRMRQADPAKIHRSASGPFGRFPGSASPSRPATPPLPTVHWTVATQELCKLLIPDRQTKSHTAAELAAPKIKKERQSSVGLAGTMPPAPAGRQLREKRPLVRNTSIAEQPEQKRVVSRGADRRRTIAANELVMNDTMGPPKPTIERARRRSSIASTVSNMSTATTATVVRPKTSTNGSGSNGVLVKKARPATVGRAVSGSKAGGDGDMDALVNRTQKLKIRMPGDEEYLARQRASAAARKGPSEPKKPAAKVGRPPKSAVGAGPAVAAGTRKVAPAAKPKASPVNEGTPDLPGMGTFQIQTASTVGPIEEVKSMGSMTGQFQLSPPVTRDHLVAAEPQMVDAQQNKDVPPLQPVFAVPPSGGVGNMQQAPPVFPSNGFIPFAPLPNPMSGNEADHHRVKVEPEEKKEVDIWGIPDTPVK